ncbi:MAG: prepilin-type N-terminal cleavage/methylation domain-containing protein [Clostridia bacterium]
MDIKNNKGYTLVEMVAALVLSAILLLFIGSTIISVTKTESDIIKLSSAQNTLLMVEAHIKANIPESLAGVNITTNMLTNVTYYELDASTIYAFDISSKCLYYNDNILSENVSSFDIEFIDNLTLKQGKENTMIVVVNDKKYLYRL